MILLAVAMITTGEWHLLVPAVGLTFALMLTGLGVGCLVGTLWQWPAPPPGANPFSMGNAGGLPSLLSFAVTMCCTLILTLPTIALVVWSFFTPWVGYLTLVGLVSGFIVLRIGSRRVAGSWIGAGRRPCLPSPRRPPNRRPGNLTLASPS